MQHFRLRPHLGKRSLLRLLFFVLALAALIAPAAAQTPTVLDDDGITGLYTAMAYNSSGNPVIAYYSNDTNDLRLAFCDNADCTNLTTTTVDDTSTDVGRWPSIALYGTQIVVTYRDHTNGDLKLALCDDDTACASPTLITVDGVGRDVGWHSDVVIDGDDARILYRNDTPGLANSTLDYAVCDLTGPTCSLFGALTTVSAAGGFPDVKISPETNFLAASFMNGTTFDLEYLSCTSADCATRNIEVVNDDETTGYFSQLEYQENPSQLGEFLPTFVYYGIRPSAGLFLTRCADAECNNPTASNTSVQVATGYTGLFPGFEVSNEAGNIGNPIISYYDATNQDLRVIECGDLLCNPLDVDYTDTAIDTAGNKGRFTSLLQNPGTPLISYTDYGNGDLRFYNGNSTSGAPEIVSVIPQDAYEENVAAALDVTITFSENIGIPLGEATEYVCGPSDTNATLSENILGNTLQLVSNGTTLAPGDTCTITIERTDIADLGNTNMLRDYVFTYGRTGLTNLISSSPMDGDTGVALDAVIDLSFSRRVNIDYDQAFLTCNSVNVPITGLPVVGIQAISFAPVSDLPPSSTCTLTIDSAVPPGAVASVDATLNAPERDSLAMLLGLPNLPGNDLDGPAYDPFGSAAYETPNVSITFNTSAPLIINEVEASQDDIEYVELYNTTSSPIPLNHVLRFYDDNGVNYQSIGLTGPSVPANGYYVVCDPGVFGCAQEVAGGIDIVDGPAAVQLYEVSAFDLVNSSNLNLTSYVNPYTGNYSSGGDGFQIYQRPAPGDGNIPFDLVDDSLPGFPNSFTNDSQGIVKQPDTAQFFGANDTDSPTVATNPDGSVTATWTFDISGSVAPVVSIDMAAMGDFEAADFFTWEYDLDSSGPIALFAGITDEAGSFTYTLADGDMFTLNDPMTVNAVTLFNEFQTFTAALPSAGTTLELSLTALLNTGAEALAFRNIIIHEPTPLDSVAYGAQPTDTAANFGEGTPEASGDTQPANDFLPQRGLSRIPDASDTNDNSTDFTQACNTPNAANSNADSNCAPRVRDPDTSPANGATGVAVDTDITIVFDESVQALSTAAFSLVCDSNPVTFTQSPPVGNFSNTFTLNPDSDLPPLVECVVTVEANEINDSDLVDPANMVADYVASFTTDAAPTPIHAVQGGPSTYGTNSFTNVLDASPLEGQTVVIQGIVVGDLNDSNEMDGFFVQEEDADADFDLTTSEGIFVFCDTQCGSFPNVNVGDGVTVTGTVAEEFSNTVIDLTTGSPSVVVDSVGNPLPTAATITLPLTPATSATQAAPWEAYEGMRVSINNATRITEYFNYDRFSELRIWTDGTSADRPYQFTQLNAPSNDPVTGYPQAERDFIAQSVVIDDGDDRQNIGKPYPTNAFGDTSLNILNSFRGGDQVEGVEGVLQYSFGDWRIHVYDPSADTQTDGDPLPLAITVTSQNPRPGTPSVSGDVRVVSINLLNYFNGDGLGGGFPTARGAETLADFNRQRAKTIEALCLMNADVYGLVEIENDYGDGANSAIQDLVNGMNASATCTSSNYAYVDPGVAQLGTDAIAVGFIYNDDTMDFPTTANNPAFLDDAGVTALGPIGVTLPVFDGPNTNRVPLAASFIESSSGQVFTAVVNHFKSKNDDSASGNNLDMNDGAGAYNERRTHGAIALWNWLGTDPTGSGDPDFLILGDLNAYAQEDPVQELILNGGYTDLAQSFIGTSAYGYVFDGRWGTLDYALANTAMNGQVLDVLEWHINADEPDALDYSTEFNPAAWYEANEFRISDHDPVIVGLDLTGAPVGGQIVINEVDYDQSSGNIFVELVNTGLGAVDVTGWELYTYDAGGNTLTSGGGLATTSIPGGGYWVICNNQAAFTNCDRELVGLQLSDNDGTVELFDGGSTVDSVVYGNPSVPGFVTQEGTPVAASKQDDSDDLGISRIPNGADSGDNDTDFQLVCITPGTANVNTQTCTPPTTPDLVINEVLFDPAGDLTGDANGDGTRDASQDEFIEVVNNGASPVDISGYTLSDDDGGPFTFPANTILDAGCAVVLFGGGTPTGTFGDALVFTDDGTIGTGLANGGDLIELRDSSNTLIDSVGYGSAGSDATGGSDQSVTLDPDGTGSKPLVNHSTATGSGGALFSPGTQIDGSDFSGCGGGSNLVINEVLYDPAGDLTGDANGDGTRDASQDEFIEVVNNGASPVDISGYTLSDDDGGPFTFPANTILDAGCAVVLFGGGTPTGTFGDALVFTDDGTIGTGLGNSGDLIELRDSSNTLIDSVGYGSAGSDATGGSDQSVTLDPDGTGSKPLVNHSTATGSGGALFSPGTQIDGSDFSGCPTGGTSVGEPVIVGFDATPDHVVGGETTVNLVLTAVAPDGVDAASVAPAETTLNIYYSSDTTCSAADTLVGSTTISEIAVGSTVNVPVTLSLPRSLLAADANSADPASLGETHQSQHAAYLCALDATAVEADGVNAQVDAAANKLVQADDITYFPWDVDGNGMITATDALGSIQSLGRANPMYDYDGNGVVAPSEALDTVLRLGYQRNNAVVEGDAVGATALPAPARTPLASVTLEVVELDATPGLTVGEPFNVNVYVQEAGNGAAAFASYLDLAFDSSVLRADAVRYGEGFSALQSANIDNAAGLVDELGGTSASLTRNTNTLVAIVRMTAIAPGLANISTSSADGRIAQTALYNSTGDVRNSVQHAQLSVGITQVVPSVPLPAPSRDDAARSGGAVPIQPVAPQPTPTPLPTLPVQGR